LHFKIESAKQKTTSNTEIENHNKNARKFELLNIEYLKLARQYNTNTEIYNSDCGGKTLR